MSVKVFLNADLSEYKSFPKLMIDKHKTIVLFTEQGKGTVVYSQVSVRCTGDYNVHWDLSCFKDYNGKVTLKNE
jgi:hypothetical protein